MLGLLNPFRLLSGPIGLIGTIATLCCCWRCFKCCRRWQLRDCALLKRFFLLTGHDGFDDFELMVVVHEAIFDTATSGKLSTVVRVTAGDHSVKTDLNSGGVFHQPLHVIVEQGTDKIAVDLLDSCGAVLSSLTLETVAHLLNPEGLQPERIFPMAQKPQGARKGIRDAKVKLSMKVYMANDTAEIGTGTGTASELAASELAKAEKNLLAKAEKDGRAGGLSEMEVLKNACAGPLEMFEGMGKTQSIYVAVLGPPYARRWTLGIWKDQSDYEDKNHALQEVDIMKVRSVQVDPKRHHVFNINFFDENRVSHTLTFRRTDRARDVWVEILHLLVTMVRSYKGGSKDPLSRGSDTSESSSRRAATTFEDGGW